MRGGGIFSGSDSGSAALTNCSDDFSYSTVIDNLRDRIALPAMLLLIILQTPDVTVSSKEG